MKDAYIALYPSRSSAQMVVAFPLEIEEKLSAMCLHWFLPHGMHLEAYRGAPFG
jgi:hypothetical protein